MLTPFVTTAFSANSRRGADRVTFSQSFSKQIGLHAEISKHALQPPVLILKDLHLAHHGRFQVAVLGPPLVKRRTADAVLAAHLGNRHPALRLAQHAHDLGFGETAHLHRNLLVQRAEKVLRLHPPNHGEDYPAKRLNKPLLSRFRPPDLQKAVENSKNRDS